VVLGVLVVVGAPGCKPPTAADPDQANRDLLTSTTWDSDPAYPDAMAIVVKFNSDGSSYLGGIEGRLTWSYDQGILTLVGPAGTFTTTPLDIGTDHVWFHYGPGLLHLKPLEVVP